MSWFFSPFPSSSRIHTFFRELLLIEGISKAGLGNWQMVAEHVGTRTKEEVEEHYNSVYIDSVNWPLPVSDASPDAEASSYGKFRVWI